MLPIATLVKRIRRMIHDPDSITYDDDEIVDTINNGIRFIRRTIADIRPEMLEADPVTGTLTAGTGRISLSTRPLKILCVRAGDEVKSSTELYYSQKVYHNRNLVFHNTTKIFSREIFTSYKTHAIDESSSMNITGDIDRTGNPEIFYLAGTSINLYPVPQKDTFYHIQLINDISELSITDKSPLPNDFDDLLIEYANIRMSIENEYDVSQDSTVYSTIYQQIMNILHVPPTGIYSCSYWDSPTKPVGGYRRRRTW